VIEFVDRLHEHFLDPARIVRGQYRNCPHSRVSALKSSRSRWRHIALRMVRRGGNWHETGYVSKGRLRAAARLVVDRGIVDLSAEGFKDSIAFMERLQASRRMWRIRSASFPWTTSG
jgi:hypothetical protein